MVEPVYRTVAPLHLSRTTSVRLISIHILFFCFAKFMGFFYSAVSFLTFPPVVPFYAHIRVEFNYARASMPKGPIMLHYAL